MKKAKLKNLVSAVVSLKDINAAHADFDDFSKVIPAEAAYPPAGIDLSPGETRTILLRVVTSPGSLAMAAHNSTASNQGDRFAVIHVPNSGDFAGKASAELS